MTGITERRGLEELADEIRCGLVVGGECGGKASGHLGAWEFEEEKLAELAEVEGELARGRGLHGG